MSSGSPAVTASPTLDNRSINGADSTDGLHGPTMTTTAIMENATNRRRTYHKKSPVIEECDDDASYMALDQLLASLALENDIMERHLSQINNNDTNTMKPSKHPNSNQTNGGVFSFETNARDQYVSNGNYQNAKQNGFDENLNDVLANLIEFSENESIPQQQHPNTNNNHTVSYMNGHHLTTTNGINGINHHHNHHLPSHFNHLHNNFNNNNNHISSNYVTKNGNGNANANGININNNHINRCHNYHEPSNNATKRLTSESENSSSVSPSLSERSNGIVSWSDQVCCNRFIL